MGVFRVCFAGVRVEAGRDTANQEQSRREADKRFNTVNKQPAGIMTDALTILSNNWGDIDGDGTFDDDLTYSLQALNSRTASVTTVNAAIMTGIVDMGASYNGGLARRTNLDTARPR